MKNILEIFQSVLSRLEDAQIDYMVVGSIASIIYGESRMTKDMDIVLQLSGNDIFKLNKIFPIEEFYCPPEEVLSAEVTHRGQFNLIHHDSGLKIDCIVRKNTPHSIEEFNRRRKTPFWKDLNVFVASPEDVIIKKLEYYREGGSEKHLTDIRGIISNTQIDKTYLESWVNKLDLQKYYQKIP